MLITIDEKLELFREIVFNELKKDHDSRKESFDQKYGNLVKEKKAELTRKAEKLLKDNRKEIEKEKTRILSKAKIEEKRLYRNMQKRIFEECMEGLIEYGKKFRDSEEYETTWRRDLRKVLPSIVGDELKVYCHEKDIQSMKAYFSQEFMSKRIEFIAQEDIIGGFILEDVMEGIRFDLTIQGKILAHREKVGQLLMNHLNWR